MKNFMPFMLILLAALPARSELLEWHSSNVQLLHGSGFELSERVQTTITLEHANGWAYGDNFIYVDYVLGQPDEINAEFSPRLSLSKIFGSDLSFGLVQDILLSGTWEKGRDFDAYLYGGAVDLSFPGFSMFQVNLYVRDDPEVDDKGWQSTVVWSAPFEVGDQKFSFDGYFDYADYEGAERNFFTQPQLLWDVGYATGVAESGQIQAGLEYRYWHNKFGIDGLTEIAPQAMLKIGF